MEKPVIKIGNAQGFWGDRTEAPAELLRAQPDLDYLTLDYLAEVSMSILARQRTRDASLGYARDFVDALRLIVPEWMSREAGPRARVITNAGGLNPRACAESCLDVFRARDCRGVKIAIVTGDDVLPVIHQSIGAHTASEFAHLESGRSIADMADKLTTASAYLGAGPIVEALATGADLIITGRVADPSMAVAPCVHHFGWRADAHDELAGATVAGHLIECGTQATGGVCTDWLDVPGVVSIGFPVVEVDAAGSCVVTKPAGTGGQVTERTVKEQLVYEIGDPDNYLSPDVTVSFLGLSVDDLDDDRVRVTGATGRAPPATYKVSATYHSGYRATGQLTIVGVESYAKAQRCGDVVHERLRLAGQQPDQWLVEYLDGHVFSEAPATRSPATAVRMSVADPSRDVVEEFARQIMPLVTAGPQGTVGYSAGRPSVQEVFGYWPCTIGRARVPPHVEVIEV